MPLAEAIAAIETHEFAARVGAASDWRGLQEALDNSEAVVELIRDPTNARRLAERVIDIARMEVDPRYEHPLDAALTAYLVVLSRLNRGLAELAASVTLRIPQLWWASKVARQTLLEANATSTATVHRAAAAVDTVIATRNDDEMLLIIPAIPRMSGTILAGSVEPFSWSSSSSEREYGNALISARNAVGA